jgi:hypothetical protein
MNTNDLITALANNDAAVGPDQPPKLGWMVGAGVASSMALLLVFWGVLTNLLATMQTPAFIAKIALVVAAAVKAQQCASRACVGGSGTDGFGVAVGLVGYRHARAQPGHGWHVEHLLGEHCCFGLAGLVGFDVARPALCAHPVAPRGRCVWRDCGWPRRCGLQLVLPCV